uniref:Uncharacterized protein n=1 Tax=viral metagenome TaxID=1070528 RepID=A0A6C0BPZ3_9ZZZZ
MSRKRKRASPEPTTLGLYMPTDMVSLVRKYVPWKWCPGLDCYHSAEVIYCPCGTRFCASCQPPTCEDCGLGFQCDSCRENNECTLCGEPVCWSHNHVLTVNLEHLVCKDCQPELLTCNSCGTMYLPDTDHVVCTNCEGTVMGCCGHEKCAACGEIDCSECGTEVCGKCQEARCRHCGFGYCDCSSNADHM